MGRQGLLCGWGPGGCSRVNREVRRTKWGWGTFEEPFQRGGWKSGCNELGKLETGCGKWRVGPSRCSDSERRERKPSDKKESRVRSRPFLNQNFKGEGWDTGVRAWGFWKWERGWKGGFLPGRLLFSELLFFWPTCADDSAVQRSALWVESTSSNRNVMQTT